MSITLGTILGNRIVSFALAPICRHNRIFKGQYNLLYGTLSLMAKSALTWREREREREEGGGGEGWWFFHGFSSTGLLICGFNVILFRS